MYVLLVDFCEAIRILSHWSKVQTVICLHQYNIPIIIDGCLMKSVNGSFRLSLDINVLQSYQKIVLWNVEFRSSSNMIPIYVVSDNVPEILSSFDIWIWISGFFSFCFEDFC